MATLRNALPGVGKTTLLVVEEVEESAALSIRNIPRVHMQRAQDLNVVDLLHHQYIIVTKSGVASLESRLA